MRSPNLTADDGTAQYFGRRVEAVPWGAGIGFRGAAKIIHNAFALLRNLFICAILARDYAFLS
jgi:hypothetical protein